MMRKKRVILILSIFVLAAVMMSSASAADSSNGGLNESSNVKVEDSSNNDSSSLPNTTNTEGVDPVIGVEVNYEYADDDINPEITINDQAGTKINYTKTKDPMFGHYILSFLYPGAANGTKFNITVAAAGYTTQMQQISVYTNPVDVTDPNFYGNAIFNMKATAAYKLGREVTKKANQLLNFTNADSVLAITTAGVPTLNGVTSEYCIEGILNEANGLITYGKGNLLMLRQTATDPIDFAFIIKKGTTLKAVVFLNGTNKVAYLGTISENMTKAQWNAFVKNVTGEDAFAFASLANAWVAGVSTDVLREAAFHGHVCEGTLGGYTIVQSLLKYYPPIKATAGGVGSPGDITSYKIIGVPGGSDDDAVMYFLDSTAGKSGYVGFDTTSTGATTNMIAFIRWTDTTYKLVTNGDGSQTYEVNVPGTGTLIVMLFDSEANKKLFQQETGVTGNGSLEELKYNTWWINKLKTDPGSLVKITYELANLTEEQYYYIVGTASNVTFPTSVNATNKGQTRFIAQEAHGLDLNYIKSLSLILPNATRATNTSTTTGTLNYTQIKQIGIDAVNLAKQIFKNELGIDLEIDDMDLAVFTSAGYVYFNGQTTEATWDGIYETLGSRLSRSTLLPIHMAIWKPLWFAFVLRGPDGDTLNTVYLRYNQNNGTFFVGTSLDGEQINDIGPNALNNATTDTNLGKYVIPDGNYFNIQSIANAWRKDPPFDQLVSFLFHDHACPGVQPGFFITDYILTNYALTGNQSYNWMASSIYCKDDSLIYLLGVSPGMGTYLNQRLTNDETASEYLAGGTEEGILMIWDPATKTARAVIISYKWPTYILDGLTTSNAQRARMIDVFIDLYKTGSSPYMNQAMNIVTSHETYLTEDEFNRIRQGGNDTTSALSALIGIPIRTLSAAIALQGGSQNNNGTTTNGTHVVDNGGSTNNGGSSSNDGSTSNDGSSSSGSTSVGLSSTPVSAAIETTTEPAESSPQKAYEVSKASSSSDPNNSNWYIYGIIGVLALGGLVGFGFMRGGISGKI